MKPNPSHIRHHLPALGILLLLLAGRSATAQDTSKMAPLATSFEQLVIRRPPDSLQFPKFYEKYTDAFGIPVVSSGKVPDAALLVGRDVINYMLLKRPDVRAAMIRKKAHLSIIAASEMQTDLPECSDWKKPDISDPRLTPAERKNYNKPGGIGSMTDKGYWNQRARGMGGTATSCAEENILGYPGTRYYGENILVHEWSHNIMDSLREADPKLYKRIYVAYENAKKQGMYKGQYAINTPAEYWAEGSQWWFWSNFAFYDGKSRVQSPEDLKAYDPMLYDILAQVYPGNHIPADVYYAKNLSK